MLYCVEKGVCNDIGMDKTENHECRSVVLAADLIAGILLPIYTLFFHMQ